MIDQQAVAINSFDLLTLASEDIDLPEWSFQGKCSVHHAENDIESSIDARWSNSGSGSVDDPSHAIWKIAKKAEYGVRIPLVRLEAEDASWSVPWVHIASHDLMSDQAELHWTSMQQTVSAHEIAATVLVFRHRPQLAYRDPLPIVRGVFGRSTGENGLRTGVFGRDALMRTSGKGESAVFCLSYAGSMLDEKQTVSLLTVLSFLFGFDLGLVAQITADDQGYPVSRTVYAREPQCDVERRPALDCMDAATAAAMASNLEKMSEVARALRFEDDVPIDVAIGTLLACCGRRLDFEIRDIALALDTILDSDVLPKKEVKYVENFRSIFAHLKLAISTLPGEVPDGLRKRLLQSICNANSLSLNARRTAFWKMLDIKPNKEIDALSKRRNTMSHTGFMDIEDFIAERSLVEDLRRLRMLVNEAILALLAYDGPIPPRAPVVRAA